MRRTVEKGRNKAGWNVAKTAAQNWAVGKAAWWPCAPSGEERFKMKVSQHIPVINLSFLFSVWCLVQQTQSLLVEDDWPSFHSKNLHV